MGTDRLRYVFDAAKILAGQEGTAKEKFAKAGQLFWSALIFVESWPSDLVERAQQISRRFMEHGTVVYTAKRLDRSTAMARVHELAESVSSLATDLERVELDGTLVPRRPPVNLCSIKRNTI